MIITTFAFQFPRSMKRFTSYLVSLSLILAVLSFSTSGDDDNVNPRTHLGRTFGWALTSVTSDFQQQAEAAIAALTDEEISAAGRTRAEITESFNTIIARETNFEDCDRDEALVFIDNGEIRVQKGDVLCPEPGDPSVIGSFNNKNYTTNADATEMTIRFPDGAFNSIYTITVLTDEIMELEQRRTVSDTLVGDVMYNISYRLSGND
jgi:hypothetical protein